MNPQAQPEQSLPNPAPAAQAPATDQSAQSNEAAHQSTHRQSANDAVAQAQNAISDQKQQQSDAAQAPVNDKKTTSSVVPDTADDNDLIEKEWVQRAKDIVNKTYNDPHRQSQELNAFKAEYIKKRYDKDIKLGE